MTEGQIANIDLVKQVNAAAVYRIIDQQGPVSRIQIAEICQLAPASITKITRQMLEHGLIREEALLESTGGRRAIALVAEQQQFQFISCRLGRKSLHIGLYNLAAAELDRVELPFTEREREPVIARLKSELTSFIAKRSKQIDKLIGLAITLPGLVNPESGEVLYMPSLALAGSPLAHEMEQHFGLPTFIGNDTRSLALAEHFFGASRDCQDSILVSVHNGTGAGIISKGKVLLGQNRNVGEIGHIQVERFGKRCQCGNFGCLETIVSNPAILERSRELLSRGHASSLDAEQLSMTSLCIAAQQGDALAVEVIRQTGEYLGQTIAIMVNLFNPQKVLLAGEIVAAFNLLLPAIRQCVEHQSLPSFHQHLPIERAHFQSQPTMGGVALIKRALLEGDLLQRIMEM
ncbi:ROK family protein [Pseudaeromonas sharmana]|uniref:ROK family protein n=1 Tax=Pseudaeromonas sharmana TaxID=328412 RepID=A0ABV8CRD1_9GAMM